MDVPCQGQVKYAPKMAKSELMFRTSRILIPTPTYPKHEINPETYNIWRTKPIAHRHPT
jgi:hypothetical protein